MARSDPATSGTTVTKSDATVYAPPLESLYIGTAGDLTVVLPDDTSQLFKNVQAGSFFPVSVKKVMSTGTTAADIIGLR